MDEKVSAQESVPTVRLSRSGRLRVIAIGAFLLGGGILFLVWPERFLADIVPSPGWTRALGALLVFGAVLIAAELLLTQIRGGWLIQQTGPGRMWGRLELPLDSVKHTRQHLAMESGGKRRLLWKVLAEPSDLGEFLKALR